MDKASPASPSSSPPPRARLPYGLDDSIDLLEYLQALLHAKYWILGAALVAAAVGFWAAKRQTPMFDAAATVALVEQQHPGGVSPDNRRAPELLTLMEHRFALDTPYENYRYRVLARMRSRRFTEWFFDYYDVLPALYPARWDAGAGAWRAGLAPKMVDALYRFRHSVREVQYNPENQLISVRMRWYEPEQAALWANLFIEGFNEFMRERDVLEAERRMRYLRAALNEARSVQMENSLYRLMEAQTARTMLASATPEYALEVIDPAVPSKHPYSPSLKKFVAGAFAGTLVLGSGLVIAWVLLMKIRRALKTRPQASDPI